MSDSTPQPQAPPAAEPHIGHNVAFWKLVATLAGLLVLTILTVSATEYDFGPVINLWIAMLIATAKASLVALYFMHLRYDKPIVSVILISTLFFVALFVSITVTDALQYKPQIQQFRDVNPAENYAPDLLRGN